MYVRRKVFSYSEPEEQLYSVTMGEEELDLFSEFMDGYYEALYSDESDVQSGRDIGQLAGGALGAAGAGAGTYAYLHGMEGRGNKALSKAQAAKRAAIEAKELNAAKRGVELEKLQKMSDNEWTLYKKEKGLKKGLTRSEYLKADGDYMKALKRANKADQAAIDAARKAGEKAVAKRNWGRYWKGNKKLVGAAVGATALTGMGAGAALGRPIGGAVNR